MSFDWCFPALSCKPIKNFIIKSFGKLEKLERTSSVKKKIKTYFEDTGPVPVRERERAPGRHTFVVNF